MRKKIFIILIFFVISCSSSKQKIRFTYYDYPKIEEDMVVDKHFDNEITDLYRNIENTNDSVIKNWFMNQTNYTNKLIKSINGRSELINRMIEFDNRKSFLIRKSIITENDNRFYLKKNIGESYYKLYYLEKNKPEVLLYDPKDFSPEANKKYTINYIKPSWNDKYIVISLSYSGKELSEMIIIDVETKRTLPQILENTWPSSFLGVNWLPDNRGFTYLYFPVTDVNNEEFKTNTQSVLYTIGEDSKKLNYIFGNKTQPQFSIGSKEYPTTKIKSSNDKYIIGYIAGVDNYWDAYYAEISDFKNNNLKWKPFYSKNQMIKTSKGVFVGNEYIYMTSKDSPNFKIESITIHPDRLEKNKVIFNETPNEVIDDFEITKSNIYVTTTKFGVEANLYKINKDATHKIILPKKSGNINMYTKSINSNDIWVSISGWSNPSVRYKYDEKNNTFVEDNLSPKVEYPEFENIIIEEVLVKSYDDEEVPMSIIYDKNLKMDNDNPAFFFGYGAYGDAINPFFSPIFLTWVKEGGILCIPHVRGGGEKGDLWHKSGFKKTKANTWKDLIACTEYIINNNYTSKDKTVIYSNSAGGIMVGRAMTERPDLFEVVISEAGILNPIRMEVDGNGGSNYKEFGSVKDSLEFNYLLEMDSYMNIKKNIKYPSVYTTVGMNDPRVMPWMSGKFIAKLQNNTINHNPQLLYADFDTGHEGSYTIKMYEEWANVFSFALWQTGHPDYQLIKN